MKRNGKSVTVDHPRPVPKWWKVEYDWAFAHHHELAKRYPNEWIAFAHRRVLAHGKALMPVLTRARQKIHRRDASYHEVPHLFVEQGIHVYRARST